MESQPKNNPQEGVNHEPPTPGFDWTTYDFAQDREGGSRDMNTNAILKQMRAESELKKRTFETSDMAFGGNVNEFVLPAEKPDEDQNPDS